MIIINIIFASTEEAVTKEFSLFGMSTSDSINAIIAILAFLGFGFSIYLGIRTLKQTKELSDKTLEETRKQFQQSMFLELFEKKYSNLIFFLDFFIESTAGCEITHEKIIAYTKNGLIFCSLFPKYIEMYDNLHLFISNHSDGSKLPDYKNLLKEQYDDLITEYDIRDKVSSFCCYMKFKIAEMYKDELIIKGINVS